MAAIGSTASSAASIGMDYLKLLVTQLQNQNPLEPMDNAQMTSQLAQISQLEKLESLDGNVKKMLANMSSNFQGAMLSADLLHANGLLGKDVSFFAENVDGSITGEVEKVLIGSDGVYLTVGKYTLPLRGVMEISG